VDVGEVVSARDRLVESLHVFEAEVVEKLAVFLDLAKKLPHLVSHLVSVFG
jgi:hypothetical protein